MARKATVDRDTVLQLLREGQTSQAIAGRYGVSRQAIDLYRKEFTAGGLLVGERAARNRPDRALTMPYPPHQPRPPQRDETPLVPYSAAPAPPEPTLDQMIELLIKALGALKRLPELESEMARLRQDYAAATSQVNQLQEREQKRREQEQRWRQSMPPGVLTYQPPSPTPPQVTSDK